MHSKPANTLINYNHQLGSHFTLLQLLPPYMLSTRGPIASCSTSRSLQRLLPRPVQLPLCIIPALKHVAGLAFQARYSHNLAI
jgi:hypothetical protein